MFKKSWVVLIVILVLTKLSWAASKPASEPEKLMGFALHLFETGEYYRAITEYQRFIYLYPENSKVPEARFQIGASYFAGDEFKQALDIWLASMGRPMPKEVRHKALYYIAASYYKLKRYTLCRKYINELQREKLSAEALLASQKLLSASYMAQERWKEAAEVVEQMQVPYAKGLSREIADAQKLPAKSPGLAGALSAILPGAGQLYAGRKQDAIMSFFLNGLFIWGTIEAYQNDKKVTGAILLFFETGWYFGNIYSATSSAYKHNQEITTKFRDKAKERLQFQLGAPGAGPLGLSLSYHF